MKKMKECQAVAVVGVGAVESPSLGDVSNNLHAATNAFTGVLTNIFYAIGVMLIASSVIKYRDHHQNASQTPLSSVIVRLLAGLIIAFLPWMIKAFGAHISQYTPLSN